MLVSVKAQLPPDVCRLVDDIESFAGIEITVVAKPERTNAACSVGGDYALIEVPSLNAICASEVLHELLHIERNWPEQVPQLIGANPASAFWDLSGVIDNLLEHIVIVPRTAKYGFDPYGYWNENHRPIWIGRSWEKIERADGRRRALLSSWTTLLHNVTDIALRKIAFDTMRQQGLLARAEDFNAEVDKLIGDKAEACSAVLRHLELPADQFRLAYTDPRRRECDLKAVP